jgi:hypothetical protein
MGTSVSMDAAFYYEKGDKKNISIEKIAKNYSNYQNVQFRCLGCGLALNLAKRSTGVVYLYSVPNIEHGEGCFYDDSTRSKIKDLDKEIRDGDLTLSFRKLMQTPVDNHPVKQLESGIAFKELHAPKGGKKTSRVMVYSAKGLASLLTFDNETNEKVRKYLVSKKIYYYTSNLIEKLYSIINNIPPKTLLIIDGVLDVERKDKLVLLSPSKDRNSLVDVHVTFAHHREKVLQKELEHIRSTRTYPGNRVIVIGQVINSFEGEGKKILEVEALDIAWRKSKLIN